MAKNILAPLGITTAPSVVDSEIQQKAYGSGAVSLIISNEEVNEIMKIVHALEDSYILLKRLIKSIKNETKERKGGSLSMSLITLGVSLLGNPLKKL